MKANHQLQRKTILKRADNSRIAESAQKNFAEAQSLHHKGLLDQAQELYQQVLELEPHNAKALLMLGTISYQTRKLHRAVELIRKAIEIEPENAGAHCNLGVVLNILKQHQAAIESYDKAIAVRPDYSEAYSNRGNALCELMRHQLAVESYDKAISIQPDLAEVHYNRGNSLSTLKQYQLAVESYDRAIFLKPDLAKIHYNRGDTLVELRLYDAALESYVKAIALRPDHAESYFNRGNVLNFLSRQTEAIASYDKAISLKPDYAKAYYGRGTALHALQQHLAAIESFDKALTLAPEIDFAYGERFHANMEICNWNDAQNQFQELIQRVQLNMKAPQPLVIIGICNSLPLQQRAAEIYAYDKYPSKLTLLPIAKRNKAHKIRLGYFSMDFRNHAVTFLTAGLFEAHDREKFEVFAFSFGLDIKDEMRSRLEGAFDGFIDVRGKSDEEIAELARQMKIDIAIDLAGFTGDSRTSIFALRAAPIQVNYLGYPGTMGADYMDYLIADRVLIPEKSRAHYTEKIVYLPCFQANDREREIADKVFTREELGLPQCGFVFCCFNNNYKITPGTFAGWMRILKSVDAGVLFLYASNNVVIVNLRKEAAQSGVDPNRLVFGTKLAPPEYLARFRVADLFLDTFPFNAGTTASDALWAGLPLLTLTGETFASRMAASLLRAIDLPELITSTQEEYEALAIELATQPERLAAIRQKLERHRLTTPLFNTKFFTQHIEGAYAQMYERYHSDLAPEHIDVCRPVSSQIITSIENADPSGTAI